MSLLIKALRQAERQNEQAARRAAEVAIELPPAPAPQPDSDTGASQTSATNNNTPLSSALNLAVESQTLTATPDRQETPAREAESDAGLGGFPTLDADFNPPPDHHQADDDPGPALSLHDDTPPEKYARHAPQTPDTSDSPVKPPASLQSEPVSPTEPAQTEPAPYLEVKAALAAGGFNRQRLLILGGLSATALLAAAVVAAIAWRSGDQAHDIDFGTSGAEPVPAFAANDLPLRRLDLGVPVQHTPVVQTDGTESASAPPPAQANSGQADSAQANPAQASPASANEAQPASARASATQTTPAAKSAPANEIARAAPPALPRAGRPAPRPSANAANTGTTSAATGNKPALPAVRFVRSTSSREQSQQLLNDAYRALQRNELARAKTAYQQALRIDRNLIDGWIGLASVAARQGNPVVAGQHYERALGIDPNDNIARTGLLALGGSPLAEESESALRTLIDSGRQNVMAELALANTLARQGRWAEAQQAYFNANAAQPNQPDTVFNLAVSLERIRQPRAALTYYQQALTLSETRQAQFDTARARQRVDAISRQLREQ